MTGRDFIFNQRYLSDFGMIMANDNSSDTNGMSREIQKGDTTPYRIEANHYCTTYNEPIVLNFFIFKYRCDNDNHIITSSELRELNSWLTYNQLPESLYVVGNDGETIEYKGIFNNITTYKYYGINGLKLSFTCSSPFTFKESKLKIDCSSLIERDIYCDSDEYSIMTYPIINYSPTSAGNLIIQNKTLNEKMSLNFQKKYNNIIIDCKMKRIIADGEILTLSDIGYYMQELNDYNNVGSGIYKMNWLRFKPKYNKVSFQGYGNLLITYKATQKLGGWVNV